MLPFDANGNLTGVPNQAGTFSFFISVADSSSSNPQADSQVFTLTVNGPPTKRFDFSVFKNIRIGEGSKKIQLRGEAFNIFNKTNFRAIQTNVTSAVYGQVTTVRDPRTIQLGAKFIF